MASTHKSTQSKLEPYIKALASQGRTFPASRGSSGTSHTKQSNVMPPSTRHTSGRPPAEHIVKLIVKSMTTDGIKYKPSEGRQKYLKTPTIHPGKALALKKVKAIHLGSHTVKKVVL